MSEMQRQMPSHDHIDQERSYIYFPDNILSFNISLRNPLNFAKTLRSKPLIFNVVSLVMMAIIY
jgi:hypothetical protein